MRLIGILAAAALACTLAGCAAPQQQQPDHSQLKVNDAGVSSDGGAQGEGAEEGVSSAEEAKPTASELRAKLDITEDSVSYTHLDVYKRQMYWRARFRK